MRILISANASIKDNNEYQWVCFYEGLLKALIRAGNDVRALNTQNFLKQPWAGDNLLLSHVSESNLIDEIKDFNPELIVAFNHSIPKVILNNTSCRVAVWDADSIEYYCDKDYIKKAMDRYTFLCFSTAGLSNAVRFGAPKEKVFLCQPATAITAESLPYCHNISFIGSLFKSPESFIRLIKESTSPQKIREIIDGFNGRFYDDYQLILSEMGAERITEYIQPAELARLSSVENRNSLLNDLQALGLTLYGSEHWQEIAQYLPYLAMSYNPKKVYSVKHNQDIYNSSRICINISHAQAVSGFPWRVMDIMASNGCLVSDRKLDLIELTKGYVNLPMYESRSEAVDLCRRLLDDNIWREDIVLGAQCTPSAQVGQIDVNF